MKDPSVWEHISSVQGTSQMPPPPPAPSAGAKAEGVRQERPESLPVSEYQSFPGRAGKHEASPYLPPALSC